MLGHISATTAQAEEGLVQRLNETRGNTVKVVSMHFEQYRMTRFDTDVVNHITVICILFTAPRSNLTCRPLPCQRNTR